MTNDRLVHAYHEAMIDYEAAKAGAGNRVEAFTRFLVAERIISARLRGIDPDLKQPERATPPLTGQSQAE
jgi:hypothetical protein